MTLKGWVYQPTEFTQDFFSSEGNVVEKIVEVKTGKFFVLVVSLRSTMVISCQKPSRAQRRRLVQKIIDGDCLGVIIQTKRTQPPRRDAHRPGDAGSSSDSNRIQQADGSVARPYFELQRSFDLWRWQPIGERERAATQTPGQNLHATLALDQPQGFFRLLSIPAGGIAKLGSGGAEVFGYGEAYAKNSWTA